MKTKLYLEPFGENKLPLDKIANIKECMKSYNKVEGVLLSEQKLKSLFISGFMLGNGSYQLGKEVDIDVEFEKQIKKL